MTRTGFGSNGDPVARRGSLPVRPMARLSYALSVVSLVVGVLLVLVTLTLSEGGIGVTGLLIGGVLILNGIVRLWARGR